MQPSGIYHPACSCAPSSSLVCAQSAACGAHTQPLSCPSSSPCQLMDGSQLALARLVSGRALADVRGPRHCRCVHFCLAPHRASSPGRRCNPVCVCVCVCVRVCACAAHGSPAAAQGPELAIACTLVHAGTSCAWSASRALGPATSCSSCTGCWTHPWHGYLQVRPSLAAGLLGAGARRAEAGRMPWHEG